MITFVFKLC